MAYLTISSYTWTVPLYSFEVACPCFHFLYSLFLCLTSARRSLQDHGDPYRPSFCLPSCCSGWTSFEFAGSDPWVPTNFLGPLFLPGPYPYSEQITEQAKVCSPEVQDCLQPSFPNKPFLLCEHEVQQSMSSLAPLSVTPGTFHQCYPGTYSILLMTYCVAFQQIIRLVSHGGLGLGL